MNTYLLGNDCYHTNIDFQQKFNNYIFNIHIPENVYNFIGIYIEFEKTSQIYEQHALYYQKYAYAIISEILFLFNIQKTSLFQEKNNSFFMLLFNISEPEIVHRICKLASIVKQKYHFDIHTGIYITERYIDPVSIYKLCLEQFTNTLHHKSMLSIKSSLM